MSCVEVEGRGGEGRGSSSGGVVIDFIPQLPSVIRVHHTWAVGSLSLKSTVLPCYLCCYCNGLT